MDVMTEFIPRDKQSTSEDMFLEDSTGAVEVISVFPPGRDDLHLGTELNMMLKLARPIDVREAGKSMTEIAQLCRLQNNADSRKYLNPL